MPRLGLGSLRGPPGSPAEVFSSGTSSGRDEESGGFGGGPFLGVSAKKVPCPCAVSLFWASTLFLVVPFVTQLVFLFWLGGDRSETSVHVPCAVCLVFYLPEGSIFFTVPQDGLFLNGRSPSNWCPFYRFFFGWEGSPTKNRLQKKGCPYSILSTGGPSFVEAIIYPVTLFNLWVGFEREAKRRAIILRGPPRKDTPRVLKEYSMGKIRHQLAWMNSYDIVHRRILPIHM